jgi:hypothetical protein
VQSGAASFVSGLAQMAGAALAFAGAKGQSFAGGMFSGALAGVSALGGIASILGTSLKGFLTGGPWGAVAIGGAALLGGLFSMFHKKSDAQKQQEKLQLDKMKADLQQTAQNVVNAAIEGYNRALEFFQKLDDFTPVRQQTFTRFFDQMRQLMDQFVAMSKAWGKDSLDKAKALADVIGPVAQAVVNGVQGLERVLKLA